VKSIVQLLIAVFFGGCYEERPMSQRDLNWIADRVITYLHVQETCPSMEDLAADNYLHLSPSQREQVTIACSGDYITLTTSNLDSLTLRYRERQATE